MDSATGKSSEANGGEKVTITNGSATKRGPPVQWSPYKLDSKRLKIEDARKIMSYIFFDFETTGLISSCENEPNYSDLKLQHPYHFHDRLKNLLDMTHSKDYPRITEMSFVCLPRDSFVRGVSSMRDKLELGQDCIFKHIACNVHTRQINPDMTDSDWSDYTLKSLRNPSINHSREDLKNKNNFRQEWPEVVKFLDSCPKPACMVAHNGMRFDYRVLFGELSRNGFLGPKDSKLSLPPDVLMVDSLLAFREIEKSHRDKLKKIVEGIEWKTVGQTSHKENRLTLLNTDVMVKPSTSGETTPVKNAPESSVSYPIHEVHPLNHFKKRDWSSAQLRRTGESYFRKNGNGDWEFRLPPKSPENNCKLGDMYKKIIGRDFNAHFAQDDSEALMQICMAFGNDFIAFCDQKASDSPY